MWLVYIYINVIVIISIHFEILSWFQSHPLSVILGGVTPVPLVIVVLIVRRDTVMVGMILVPVVCMNSELLVTVVQ